VAGPLTAFPQTEAALGRTLRGAGVDRQSFARPLEPCVLAACGGMCCYDGAYVGDEEAAVLRDLAGREGAFFRAAGLDLPAPDEVVVDGEWEGTVSGLKTALRPHPFSRRVADYPGHFRDTACVFLLPDGRCSLQTLAVARGRHPWFFKPFSCWQHPIAIVPADEAPAAAAGGETAVVRLDDEASDPYRLPGYDGYVPRTWCGRTAPAGRPASEVLRAELDFLGAIAGRDLLDGPRGDGPAATG
jgi:hypothetical protein